MHKESVGNAFTIPLKEEPHSWEMCNFNTELYYNTNYCGNFYLIYNTHYLTITSYQIHTPALTNIIYLLIVTNIKQSKKYTRIIIIIITMYIQHSSAIISFCIKTHMNTVLPLCMK